MTVSNENEKALELAENAPKTATKPSQIKDKGTTKKEAEKAVATKEKPTTYIYIGPDIPNGVLKSNTLFRGTKSTVLDAISKAVSLYPDTVFLLIAVSDLSKARKQIKDTNTALGNHYKRVEKSIKP